MGGPSGEHRNDRHPGYHQERPRETLTEKALTEKNPPEHHRKKDTYPLEAKNVVDWSHLERKEISR